MQAKELISDIFPAVNINDKGEKALVRMDFFKISHIPLTDSDGNYFGLISENEIYDFDLVEKAFSSYKNVLARPYVICNQHIYSVINLFAKMNISVVPVLNDREKYVGAICFHDLIVHLATLTASDNPGTIFILELDFHSYSLSQIAQIVESNDAKILSLYVSSPKNSTKLEVTVKLNTTDFSSVRQTFERYDYKIKAAYNEDDKINELLEERFDEFMNYLNI
ncbi:MAG: CBS domain-containing protein [Bacteroidales bacterium]|nr:CBS domain-containing protein [Bacteroidales bacterium]